MKNITLLFCQMPLIIRGGGITNNINKLVPMLFMLLNPYYYSLSAQEDTGLRSCGNAESFSEFTPSSTNDCFIVNDVQSNCTTVWVKVNVHFFLEDDCSGTLDPSGNDPATMEDAYEKADDLINNWFNSKLENNHEQWNQIPMWGISTVQPAQCNPIRYALSGVYVHCNSAARNTSGSNLNYFKNNFAVNLSSEFNAFFVEWIGTSGGQADGVPGKAFTTEDFTSAIFRGAELISVAFARPGILWLTEAGNPDLSQS